MSTAGRCIARSTSSGTVVGPGIARNSRPARTLIVLSMLDATPGHPAAAMTAFSWFAPPLLCGLPDRYAPMDAVFLGRVVAGCLVVRAAVVPDHDIALAPFVRVVGPGLHHVGPQLGDEAFAFFGGE